MKEKARDNDIALLLLSLYRDFSELMILCGADTAVGL